ncbi:MAG: S8 family serine peptidase, partial [Pseudomonadales bacterium]|nr:S8 family serine peptidase [Pseudomonadales bacterium]
FPTAKVIGGYDFAGATYDASVDGSVPTPDPDPLDGDGHGSHVSGIAAGLGVPGKIGVGVAPGASILALKVFGDVAGSTSLVSDAIEMALDPNGDGDISDHADVINMSLGSDYGTPDDPSAVASQNAADMGIVVVSSAGNAGPIPYITGSPAVASAAISVASSLAGGETTGIDVNGDSYESVEGAGPVKIADGAVTGDLAVPSDAANANGCDPIADDMTNKIALISRGVCSFDLKYINAQAAGASAIVVYNDGTAPDRIAPIIMGGVGDLGVPITIPGTMISAFDGYALAAAVGGTPLVATLDEGITAESAFGDTISDFSSQGPGGGGSGFKPDLTAPGSGIVSTGVGTGTDSETLSGTSMASPHVAGVAALVLAQNPGLTVEGVKAMLQNSTVDAVPDGTIGDPQPMSRQGAGVVRADKAVELTSYATPGGVSFGRLNPSRRIHERRSVELVNLATESRWYNVTTVPNHSVPGVEVSCPKRVRVNGDRDSWRHGHHDRHGRGHGWGHERHGKGHGKGHDDDHHDRWKKNHDATTKFDIVLRMDPKDAPYDDAFESQTEVDGWCVLNDGDDELRVAYMAVVDPASTMRAEYEDGVLNVSNGRGNVGWAEGFTLTGEDGLLLDDKFNAFRAMGFRSNSYAAEGDLIEFGVASEKSWESFATGEIDIYVDVDGDGVDDAILIVADFFEDGFPVTAVFPQGAALFDAGADYNDGSAILTFFSKTDAPLGSLGFLPPGDTDFDYTAVFFDVRTGEYDVQFGSVDLANEIVPAASTFGLEAHDSATLPVSGSGDMLWLYQNNEVRNGDASRQAQVVNITGAGGE